MRLQRQTLALGAVGIVDLITTLVFIHRQDASEANPMMAAFLSQGLVVFLIAKMGFLVGPLAVLEWARRFNPIFVARAVNLGMAAYVCFYGVGVARINTQPDFERLEEKADPVVWHRIEARLAIKRKQLGIVLRHASRPNGPSNGTLIQAVD